MPRVHRCLYCGGKIDNPDFMEPLELKLVRGVVGNAKGYRAPMPLAKFARLVGVSPRSLDYYLAGEREIPPLVAREARRLEQLARNDPDSIRLPKKWEAQRVSWLRRRERAAQRQQKRSQ